MTIEQFIQKAIEGGWKDTAHFGEYTFIRVWEPSALEYRYEVKREDGMHDYISISPNKMFLEPLAWQAVGKAEGWDESYFHKEARDPYYELGYDFATDAWKMNMHRMIDALAEGKTIEQFIETL